MTRLTLDEERRMIDKARTFRVASAGEYERLLEERFGVAFVDQYRAASDEAGATWRMLHGKGSFKHVLAARPSELAPLLMAGMLRCLAASRCEHAVHGDRPLVCVLAARVVACHDCLPRFLGALAASDQRVARGDDRLCDFCLEEPDPPWFFRTSVPFGPAVVFGDMCQPCQNRAKADDGETPAA